MTTRLITLTGLVFIIAACGGKKSDEPSTAMPMNQQQQDDMQMDTDEMEQHNEMQMDSGKMQMHDGNMDMSDKSMGENEKLAYYTCPMEAHNHVHSDEPGDCPECGMKLVETVITDAEHAEFYGCPMEAHSHVRSDKPGICTECGMNLKPMRLKKS